MIGRSRTVRLFANRKRFKQVWISVIRKINLSKSIEFKIENNNHKTINEEEKVIFSFSITSCDCKVSGT